MKKILFAAVFLALVSCRGSIKEVKDGMYEAEVKTIL